MVKEIFLFIDGVGLAPPGADNPVQPEVCPMLCKLIAEHSTPIDACLGVPGLPQSATGQATMFCGRNAPAFMNRHVEGFPGPTLRKFVEEGNVFQFLKARGLRARFADGYLADSIDEIRNRRFRSVTTTAALTVPEVFSLRSDLLENQAVCHDITRESLVAKGFQGETVTPAEAAEHLVQLAIGYDYTLFEYFLSDQAGHSSNMETAKGVLRTLDAFLSALVPLAVEMGMGVTLTSDHGNIECMSVKTHTCNSVPLIAVGPGSDLILARGKSLVDVTPLVIEAMTGEPFQFHFPLPA